jgi:hypothetical protein
MDTHSTLQTRLVLIEVEEGEPPLLGSGFFVDDSGHVLTCWHVVAKFAGAARFLIRGGSGATRYATLDLQSSNPDADLAVLTTDPVPGDPVPWSDVYQDSDLQIWTLTSTGSERLQVLYDSVRASIEGGETSLGTSGLRVLRLRAADITHGMSGSPVVDRKTGHIIGILSHRRGPGEAFAIPFRLALAKFPALIRCHYWVEDHIRALKADYEDSRSESPFYTQYFKLDLNPDHIFVAPEDHELLKKLRNYRRYPITRAVETFPDLFIVGEPGGGKTTAVREVAKLYERSYGNSQGPLLLPLYIPITETGQSGDGDAIAISLVQAAFKRLEPFSRMSRTFAREQIYDLLDQYRFVFLFDGLNEIAVERIGPYCQSLRHFMSEVRRRETRTSIASTAGVPNRFVITSRVDNILKCRTEIAELTKHRFELQKLTSDEQVAAFVEMHIPDPELRSVFLTKIDQHYATSQMAQNPLLLTMMVIVFLRSTGKVAKGMEAASGGSSGAVVEVALKARGEVSHELTAESAEEAPLGVRDERNIEIPRGANEEAAAVDRDWSGSNDELTELQEIAQPDSHESAAPFAAELPLSRASLLKHVVNGLLGDWSDDPFRSTLTIRNKHSLLAGLAYELRAQRLGLGASEGRIREIATRVCTNRMVPTLPQPIEVTGILDRAVRDRVLRRDAGALRFWPEVFQEYLAGWVISKDIEVVYGNRGLAEQMDVWAAKRRINRYLANPDWHQCFAIGAGLVSLDAANRLVSRLTKRKPLLAAHCIANASQLDTSAVEQFTLTMKDRARVWLRIPFIALAISAAFSATLIWLVADTDITTPYRTVVSILAKAALAIQMQPFPFVLTSAGALTAITLVLIKAWYRAVEWCEDKVVNEVLPNGLLHPLLRSLIVTGTQHAEVAIGDLRAEAQRTRYVGAAIRNLIERAGIILRFRKNELSGLLTMLESDGDIEYAIDRLSQLREPAAIEPLIKVIKTKVARSAQHAAGAIALISTVLEEPEREDTIQKLIGILESTLYGYRKRMAVYHALADMGETRMPKPRLFVQLVFNLLRAPMQLRLAAAAIAILAIISFVWRP